MTNKNAFKEGQFILDTLESNGFEAYYVGGSVRDYCMGKSVGDIDITTNALPKQIEALFKHTIDVGIEHGTIVVVINKTPYEVTTYRTETTYSDFRRPDSVEFTTSLKEDLARRDFTMNAIAMDKHFKLYDPYDGQSAIEDKEIITVGNPDERFNEDALRMLRALRFMSQLQFDLNEDSYNAIKKLVSNVQHISVERIVQELKKLYKGINIEASKRLLIESDMYKYIPFFNRVGKDDLKKSVVHTLNNEIIIQLLFNDSVSFKNELKLSNEDKKYINTSIQLYDDLKNKLETVIVAYKYDTMLLKNMLKILSDNSALNINMEDDLLEAIQKKESLTIQSKKDLAVNGNDLMNSLNKRGGPWLKELLDEIEHQILFETLPNDFDAIIEWVHNEYH